MRIVSLLLFVLPLTVLGQTEGIPKSVTDQLSRDLSELQKTVLEAQAPQQPSGLGVATAFGKRVAVTETTSLRAAATDTAPTMYRVTKGEVLPVVAESPGWYAVTTNQPVQGPTTAWLRAGFALPVVESAPQPAVIDNVFQKLTEHAARFKQSYQNNPYVTVSGFQVNLVPPSIAINFEFKK